MNKKGQALIAFIIILPILILIISCIIDFGNIIYQKYKLTNDLDIITDMYLNNDNDLNNYLSDINATINYDNNGNYTNIKLIKEIDINTIILNNIIGKKYQVSTSKTIYNGDYHG